MEFWRNSWVFKFFSREFFFKKPQSIRRNGSVEHRNFRPRSVRRGLRRLPCSVEIVLTEYNFSSEPLPDPGYSDRHLRSEYLLENEFSDRKKLTFLIEKSVEKLRIFNSDSISTAHWTSNLSYHHQARSHLCRTHPRAIHACTTRRAHDCCTMGIIVSEGYRRSRDLTSIRQQSSADWFMWLRLRSM